MQKAADYEDDIEAWAKYYHNVVFAAFDSVRTPADELEKRTSKDSMAIPYIRAVIIRAVKDQIQ